MEDLKETGIEYDSSHEPIVLSKATLDIILRSERPSDALALYAFYYLTAKWQKNNQVKAVTSYAANGLKWTIKRVQQAKEILLELGLIENVKKKKGDGTFAAHYVKINFIWTTPANLTEKTLLHPSDYPSDGENHPVENRPTNTYPTTTSSSRSTGRLKGEEDNARASNQNLFEVPITQKQFQTLWNLYPKKTNQGQALSAWTKLCKGKKGLKPSWRTLRLALKEQIKSNQWQDPQFIPNPASWLNKRKWEDNIYKLNKVFIKKGEFGAKGKAIKYKNDLEV